MNRIVVIGLPWSRSAAAFFDIAPEDCRHALRHEPVEMRCLEAKLVVESPDGIDPHVVAVDNGNVRRLRGGRNEVRYSRDEKEKNGKGEGTAALEMKRVGRVSCDPIL